MEQERCYTPSHRAFLTIPDGRTITNSRFGGQLNPKAQLLGYNIPIKPNRYPASCRKYEGNAIN